MKCHGGWDARLWTEGNLPKLINATEFQKAQSFAQMADIVRYEVVHAYGGVYLDTDMECLRNIEPALSGVDAFAAWLEPDEIGIGVFGAVPHHPWLSEVITRLPHAMKTGFGILHQTGPRFLTTVTKQRTDVVLFEKEAFYATGTGAPESYSVHHAAKSWGASQLASTEAKLLAIAQQEIDPQVFPGTVFIRVDDDIGIHKYSSRKSVSFLVENSENVGPPADDEDAIRRLERMKQNGAMFIAFVGPSSWWLEYYCGLREHLRRTARCVRQNERIVLYDLNSSEK